MCHISFTSFPPGFFLMTDKLLLLWAGVWHSGGRGFELWDINEEELSTTSPLMADRQLWSELLKLMHSPDDSVLSAEGEKHIKFKWNTDSYFTVLSANTA